MPFDTPSQAYRTLLYHAYIPKNISIRSFGTQL